MGAEAMVILGFDPGGVKQFGWCVAQATDNGRLHFRASGVASHAAGAVRAALGEAEDFGRIGAAGIDSPLLWVADGDRKADKAIRSAMKQLGAINIGGTVQQVNSLRGACFSQGISETCGGLAGNHPLYCSTSRCDFKNSWNDGPAAWSCRATGLPSHGRTVVPIIVSCRLGRRFTSARSPCASR